MHFQLLPEEMHHSIPLQGLLQVGELRLNACVCKHPIASVGWWTYYTKN